MRPTDSTLGTYEEKLKEAVPLAGVGALTASEVAAVKERIRFVLFDSNPADLTVAQLSDWIQRVVPGLRRSTAVIAAHSKIADGFEVNADLLPPSLRNRTIDPPDETLAAGEVLCSLVGDRKVRFNPANMVVTPLRIEVESE